MLGADEYYEIEESELPEDLTDPKVVQIGEELGREFRAFSLPRASLEKEIWPACDRAFMCIKDDMPYIPTMKLVDNGMLGRPDVRSAIKKMRNALISQILPGDNSNYEPARDEDDTEDDATQIRDLIGSKFNEAGIHEAIVPTVDQWLARGFTAIGLRWDSRYLISRPNAEMRKTLKIIAKAGGFENPGREVPLKRPIFEGPVLYPIDVYRLWLDPATDLSINSEQAYIYLVFKSLNELKNAKDENGDHIYDQKALEGVGEWTYQEWYSAHPWACYSTRFMGIDPSLEDMGKFVPVYLFYRQERVTEDGSIYMDKLFYVARNYGGGGSSRGNEWTPIRVQNNPHPMGHKPFFACNYDPWMNSPYGTGVAEKSISTLKALNILDAVGLNYRVLMAFPPMSYIGGVIKDDRKPKIMPAGMQEIIYKPNVGLDWCKPFPFTPNLQLVTMQDTQYLARQIVDQTGATNVSVTSDQNKSLSKEKTAEEVKQETAEGSVDTNVATNRFNIQITEPMANAMYDMLRAKSQGASSINYTTMDKQNNVPRVKKMNPQLLQKDRDIKIVGKQGLMSRAQETSAMNEMFKYLSSPQAQQVIPNLRIIMHDLIIRAVTVLGMPMKPEYKMTPQEIFAGDPEVMQQAFMNIIQNPEALQKVLADPQAFQLITQALEQTPQGKVMIQDIANKAIVQHQAQTAGLNQVEPSTKQQPGAA